VANDALVDRTIEPRLNQVFVPLLSIIEDSGVRNELKELARRHQQELVTDRSMSTEAQVLDVINELLLLGDGERLSIKEITSRFTERFGEEYERKVTNRWIGNVLRKRLGLKPYKSDGTFVMALTSKTRSTLERLAAKHGIALSPAAVDTETAPSAATSPDDLSAIRF
jgi:hypothetical protein